MYIHTVNKGGGGEQFERERHSIQTGLTMPRPEVEAIIQKLDSRGNVASAVFALTYAPYTDVEQSTQEVGGPVDLSLELGFKGDEGKYRCLGLAGVQLADNQDNIT